MSAQTTRVRRVDPTEEASLTAWYEVLCRALDEDGAEDAEEAVLPLEDMREALRPDGSGGHALAFVALEEDGTPVGALLLEYDEEAESDTVEVDIAVLPRARRRGHGTALLRTAETVGSDLGRTTQVVEISSGPDQDLAAGPGGGFALAHGFEVVGAEDLHVLELPLPPAVDALLRERVRPGEGEPEVTGWQDECPDDLMGPCSRLRQALGHGRAHGDEDGQADGDDSPAVEDYAERVRLAEARRAEEGVRSLVSVALDTSGTAVGLSELVLLPGSGAADQAGTLVLPEHRGRGLGSRLWLRNLTELARAFPERERVRARTDPEDTAARETAADLGFRPVERTFALERTLQGA
ncbi:GNAT family N-acetyltransferase [Nocardiopsis xinjiangensis]|uniref:GNAT family N-acetyltransferase n=1 Tax=Nocardiopsis xinjiangensis TaxID=124285 RepID=UPI00036E75F6|nr:GNAT family N-acetyltransferase [Nocardiopsis xinjiangensis]